jgi:hypothetical protein
MALATVLCLLVHGCQGVSGGAVELSWKLRPASASIEDKFVGCTSGFAGTGPVARIRLDWTVRAQAGDPAGDRSGSSNWACTDNHGVTGFELPEGDALLSVTPLCEEDTPADPSSYIVPAAEQRLVIAGDTISLGAVEIVARVTSCTPQQPCICDSLAAGHTTGR